MSSGEENEATGTSGVAPGITIEELVQATVRAMVLHERATSNSTPQSQPAVVPSQIATLLPEFSGRSEDVDLWLERVDSVQAVYEVEDKVMQLVAVGKLQEVAKQWYLSKVDYVTMDWDTLKREMRRMFGSRPDKLALRKKFESRRWRRSEKFADYFHEKVLLGNKAGVEEDDMIEYVIDGYDDRILQSQARMQNFKTLEELLKTMKNVTDRGNISPSVSGPPPQVKNKPKCFNCNREGHRIADCNKPKRTPGSCFECGSTQHQVKNCPKKKPSTSQPDSTTMLLEVNSSPFPDVYAVPVKLTTVQVDEVAVVDN